MKRILLLTAIVITFIGCKTKEDEIIAPEPLVYEIISDSNKTAQVIDIISTNFSRKITIPQTIIINKEKYKITKIGNNAFYGCTKLNTVEIPNTVNVIGDWAFENCYKLVSAEIPNSVTIIGNSAFCSCLSLTSVLIPSSVRNIGAYAFNSCSGLTEIRIPESVRSIGRSAFAYCTKLNKISVLASIPPTIDSYAFTTTKCILEVPLGTKIVYQLTPGWKDFETINEVNFSN